MVRIPIGLVKQVIVSSFSFFPFSHMFSLHHTVVPFVYPLWSNEQNGHQRNGLGTEVNTNQGRKSIQGVENRRMREFMIEENQRHLARI